MKKIIFLFAVLLGVAVQAQDVPFAYTSITDWAAIDSTQKSKLHVGGAYNDSVVVGATAILETILVHGVPSRSGNVEDQVWMKIQNGNVVTDHLFSLKQIPTITQCGKVLEIKAFRGDDSKGKYR